MGEKKKTMSLEMTVFNVERGLSVCFRTPNNYGILIDCGSSETLSPVSLLRTWQQEPVLAFTPWKGQSLAYFVVTHPHSDHLSNIVTLHDHFKPQIVRRRKYLDWDRVRKSNLTNTSFDYYLYHFFPPHDYGQTVPQKDMPVWGDGMTLTVYSLPINDVERVSTSDNSYTNNSSLWKHQSDDT